MPGDPTPPQTVGPFFQPSLLGEPRTSLVTGSTSGERIVLDGRVLDGDGHPVSDAMLEVWQANAAGRYRHPADARPVTLDESFIGFGRSGTDVEGHFAFETIKPGPVPGPAGSWQAPHLNVLVFARGLLDRLATRIYFEDDGPLAMDPFLLSLPEDRRSTLVARRETGSSPPWYRHDVVLRGDAETVFFDA
jgi:protocatechuate 3,4-dioxygenase alpha subunit